MVVSCSDKYKLDEIVRQYFFSDVSKIDFDIGKNEIWLNRIETKFG